MPTLKIDSKTVTAREGETILQAARRHGIAIPSLCHHEAVEPYGACRLCVVEVTKKEWKGWSRLVTACLYPVEAGLDVDTRSEKVLESRRTTLDLLLARCPDTPKIREMAAAHGVEETSFEKREDPDSCILCGLCVRICGALGHHAIALANRGPRKVVTPPFGEPADACVGCGACAKNCPTLAIALREIGRERRIWDRAFKLVPCKTCGATALTEEQVRHLCREKGFTEAYFEKCDACRRKETAGALAAIVQW